MGGKEVGTGRSGRKQESLENSRQKEEIVTCRTLRACVARAWAGVLLSDIRLTQDLRHTPHYRPVPVWQALAWLWSQGVSPGLDRFGQGEQPERALTGQPLSAGRAEPEMGCGGDPKGRSLNPCCGQMSTLRLAQGHVTPKC